jgi:predicted amidophosphoribosyltransferase
MHDELCRKCGGTLTNWSLCSECRKPVKRICVLCGWYTDEIIHSQCFYHLESIRMRTPNIAVREVDPELKILA